MKRILLVALFTLIASTSFSDTTNQVRVTFYFVKTGNRPPGTVYLKMPLHILSVAAIMCNLQLPDDQNPGMLVDLPVITLSPLRTAEFTASVAALGRVGKSYVFRSKEICEKYSSLVTSLKTNDFRTLIFTVDQNGFVNSMEIEKETFQDL